MGRLRGRPRGMGLNGNRFKLSGRSMPCLECMGYPPLKLKEFDGEGLASGALSMGPAPVEGAM